jgi:hypothetical protein
VQFIRWVAAFVRANAGKSIDVSNAIIAITVANSSSVNAVVFLVVFCIELGLFLGIRF